MKIGFVGVGKIASAIVQGLCTSSAGGMEIFLSPRGEELSVSLAAGFPTVARLLSNQEVLDRSDIVVIAVRPPIAGQVLSALRFREDQTVVSLVATLPYDLLFASTRPAGVVCRAIPLPTVVHHNCPIPLYRADERVQRLFGYVGETMPVSDEKALHALWTLTGLIAPFFDLLGQLGDWTVAHGADRDSANVYLADMFQSLCYMAQQSRPIDFAKLAHHAATPGGINEQAAKQIADAGAHGVWVRAAEQVLRRF